MVRALVWKRYYVDDAIHLYDDILEVGKKVYGEPETTQ